MIAAEAHAVADDALRRLRALERAWRDHRRRHAVDPLHQLALGESPDLLGAAAPQTTPNTTPGGFA